MSGSKRTSKLIVNVNDLSDVDFEQIFTIAKIKNDNNPQIYNESIIRNMIELYTDNTIITNALSVTKNIKPLKFNRKEKINISWEHMLIICDLMGLCFLDNVLISSAMVHTTNDCRVDGKILTFKLKNDSPIIQRSIQFTPVNLLSKDIACEAIVKIKHNLNIENAMIYKFKIGDFLNVGSKENINNAERMG